MSGVFSLAGRFWRDRRGSASVEFVLIAPLFIAFAVFSVELGLLTLRATMLERGLDMAVREIRLGDGDAPDHDEIKDIICARAAIISNCGTKLRLEMQPTDIRDFTPLDAVPDCVDAEDPGKPLKNFVPGGQNRLTLMRACLKYTPIFPRQVLGQALARDTSGDVTLLAATSFVQEPL